MTYNVKKRESSRTKVPMTNNDDLFGGAAAKRAAPATARNAAVKVSRQAPPQGTPGEAGYDASAIAALEGLEPVRRRPGMYIGGTDEQASHHLSGEGMDTFMD